MGTDMDAGITLHTFDWIKADLFVLPKGQRPCGTVVHAGAAVLTKSSSFRIMAIFAVNIASLKENGCSISRPVHAAERDNLIYNCFH